MEKFEQQNVQLLLCEGSNKLEIMKTQYDKDSFSFITGSDLYKMELEKSSEFPIKIKHFDIDINYNTGVVFINNNLWWSVGGQSKVSMENQDVLNNNGVGEDIVFVRTIMKNMKDKDKFIIMRNPLLVKRASSIRNETHWNKDDTIKESKTLPEIKVLIEKRVNPSK